MELDFGQKRAQFRQLYLDVEGNSIIYNAILLFGGCPLLLINNHLMYGFYLFLIFSLGMCINKESNIFILANRIFSRFKLFFF